MSHSEGIIQQLKNNQKVWLITGVAGFIGSNLLETLLKLNQLVIGLDNFSTGHQRNLNEVQASVTSEKWQKFEFIEGDICDYETCESAVKNTNYVLHQAALGSVPRSIKDPITSNESNVTGFLNILHASKEANVTSLTYAASSSTYGDHSALPKVERNIGKPLSPYAVTKYINELYADVYSKTYGFNTIGLRYFNVFGKRQDPNGAYAAVIPKWTAAMIKGEQIFINGDGITSRDFCYVKNVIQANIIAAVANNVAKNNVYNIAKGDKTELNTLFYTLKKTLSELGISYELDPVYQDFRLGDVRHSQADISKAQSLLGYQPLYNVFEGIKEAMPWYVKFISK